MADQVQAGYSRLDTGIKERTAELEQAVAQLHETQEQLVRREKLAMLGQLASGVGHELRNPLGVMTNAVYYLEMVQTDAPPDVQEYLGILRAQIGLAEKIVGDLLDFSRVRPPRRDVAAARRHRRRPAGPPRRAAEHHADASTCPPTCRGVSVDVVQIGQIVFNLLLNAMQAIERDAAAPSAIGAATSDSARAPPRRGRRARRAGRAARQDLRAAVHHQGARHRPRPGRVAQPGRSQRRHARPSTTAGAAPASP